MTQDKGTLEYNKEMNGRTTRMKLKKSSFGNRHKSVVTEEGKVTTISIIKTDRQGYPVKIIVKEPQTGNKTVETNIFDENHNVIEKHNVSYNGADGTKEEKITAALDPTLRILPGHGEEDLLGDSLYNLVY